MPLLRHGRRIQSARKQVAVTDLKKQRLGAASTRQTAAGIDTGDQQVGSLTRLRWQMHIDLEA